MAAGGSYFQSRLGQGGGGGTAPVATTKGSAKTVDKHYALKLGAYNRALRNAARKRARAAAARRGGVPSFAAVPFTPAAPPASPPIVNPFPKVLAGVRADSATAQKAVAADAKAAQQALRGLGEHGTAVAGAGSADIAAGAASGIEGTARGISSNISAQAARFIMEQIAQRQQFQMEQAQRNQITPDTLRQLVAAGIDPSRVNLNDPFSVAMALGQAQRGSGSGLSFGQIASLAQAGIDPSQYQDDPFAAAVALGRAKRSQSVPSASDIAALLKAAQ